MFERFIWASAASAFLAAPSSAEGPGEWRPIFDGKTLNGWVPKVTRHALGDNWRRPFRVQNGAIRVSYDGYERFGGRFGHLSYRRPIAAPFRVRFEYRFHGTYLPDVEAWQHSNSGLMFHGQAPETIGRNQQFPVSLELQLLGADGAKPRSTGNLCTPGTHVVMAGKLVTEHCINSSSSTYQNGRWIRVELDVRKNGRITHVVNGKPVMSYSGAQFDPGDADAKPLLAKAGGELSLTGAIFRSKARAHPVGFRKIELKELR